MSVFSSTPLEAAWRKVCEDPRFQDCPYKVELSLTGKIIMSPSSNDHVYLQVVIHKNS